MEQTLVLRSLCLGTTCACDDLWSFLSQTSGQTRMWYIQLDMAAAVVLLYYDYNATTCMIWVKKKKKKNTSPTLTRCPVSPYVCNIFFLLRLDVEVQRMKKAVESLMVANEEKVPEQINLWFVSLFRTSFALNLTLWWTLHMLQDRKIDELKQSLLRYKKVQDMVMSVQVKKGERTPSSNEYWRY